MSLTSKIVLILSAVVALYAVTDYAIQRETVARSFRALEEADGMRDAKRVFEAIQEERDRLDQYCLSRSSWYGTGAFVAGMNWWQGFPLLHPELLYDAQRYATSHLSQASFQRDKIDLLYLVDVSGRVVWSRIEDPETRRAIDLRAFPKDRLGRFDPLLARGVIEERNGPPGTESPRDIDRKGVLITEHGPMLVSARPIASSSDKSVARGTIIVGRFIGPELIRALSERTKVQFEFWSLGAGPLPLSEQRAFEAVSASSDQAIVREANDELLYAYTVVPNMLQAPGLLVRADLQRRVSLMGKRAVQYALVSTVTVGLLMLLVLLALLKRAVLTPLTTLTRNAVALSKNEGSSVTFDLRRNDEVGILSREFDNMLAKLARSRAEIVRTARAAGMSEIATGILHNVGNVLNSVNVSASLVGRRARNLCVADLEALSRVLADHAHDLASFVASDPRGRHLQPYVDALAREMRDMQQGIDQELGSLTRGIDHIRELIDSQQSYVGRGGVTEALSVEDQLEEALSISEKALSPDPGIEIVREYARLPQIVADRHKLLEILVNLLQNARQALAGSAAPVRRIALCTRDLGERVQIEVRDTGHGIDPNDLVRIFNLGFTTRPDGHGIGLHASANAAKEMSGFLSVHSAGRGLGASFVLELPKSTTNGKVAVA